MTWDRFVELYQVRQAANIALLIEFWPIWLVLVILLVVALIWIYLK